MARFVTDVRRFGGAREKKKIDLVLVGDRESTALGLVPRPKNLVDVSVVDRPMTLFEKLAIVLGIRVVGFSFLAIARFQVDEGRIRALEEKVGQ